MLLNGEVLDIRKSTISPNLVHLGHEYAGPVIVKSNLNYAGAPERALSSGTDRSLLARVWSRLQLTLHPPEFKNQGHYKLYDRVQDVPRRYLESDEFIVEKFLPERQGDLFCVRHLNFLGTAQNMQDITRQVAFAAREQSNSAREITGAIESMNSMTQQVAQSSVEQKRGGDMVVRAIDQIAEIAQQNLLASRDLTEATGSLMSEADQLRKMSEVFKT